MLLTAVQFGSTFGHGSSCTASAAGWLSSVPVVLVANKADQIEDRMVSRQEGEKRSRDLGCDQFFEISVREQVDAARHVAEQLYLCWKRGRHSVIS